MLLPYHLLLLFVAIHLLGSVILLLAHLVVSMVIPTCSVLGCTTDILIRASNFLANSTSIKLMVLTATILNLYDYLVHVFACLLHLGKLLIKVYIEIA